MDGAGTAHMDGDIEEANFRSAFSAGTDIFIGLYITTVGLLSLGTNIVVLWGQLKKKQDMTDMDVITVNISICQVAPTILSYPLVLMSAFSHGWYFSELDCKRDGFFIYFFAMSTIGSLLLMTVYRYLRMFNGHLFSRQNTPRVRLMVFLGLGASYLYGLLWALPPLLGCGVYILEPHHMACSVEWTSLPLPYTLGILVLGYFLPVFTMAGIYGRIVATVRSSSRQISTRSHGAFRKDYHVTIVAILHCTCFLMVWTPYAVLSFMSIFSLPVSNTLYVMSSLFAKIDTLVNPFVFFVINKMVSNRSHKADNVREPVLKLKKQRVQWEEEPTPLIQLGSADSRLTQPRSAETRLTQPGSADSRLTEPGSAESRL